MGLGLMWVLCRQLEWMSDITVFILPHVQPVNQHVYKDILQRLLQKIRWKRRDLWGNNSRIHHHDTAPAHSALSVRQLLGETCHHLAAPTRFSWQSPCNLFFLAPKIKGVMKRTHFDAVWTITWEGCYCRTPMDSGRIVLVLRGRLVEKNGQACA